MKFCSKKLMTIALSVVCIFALVFALTRFYTPQNIMHTFSTTATMQTVVIDAGHGGFDGGATSVYGVLEKDINLSIARKLEQILKLMGYKTVMTRTDDGALATTKKEDMYARLEIANSTYDSVFISIHQNCFSQEKYFGAQMFYGSANAKESEKIALILKENFRENINPQNNREIKKAYSDLFLFKKINSPCVLIECGFLSNNNEALLLNQNDYQTKIAFTIAQSICEYYREG